MSEGDFATRAAALAERAGAEQAEAWRPSDAHFDHPEVIVGELVDVTAAHTSYGPTRVVTLRTSEGKEWAVWLVKTVLRQEFEKLQPRRGELVAVRFLGRVDAREGRPAYDAFRVVVDRDDVGDWGASAVEDEATAAAARCDQCGYDEPEHAAGCPNEIPF